MSNPKSDKDLILLASPTSFALPAELLGSLEAEVFGFEYPRKSSPFRVALSGNVWAQIQGATASEEGIYDDAVSR